MQVTTRIIPKCNWQIKNESKFPDLYAEIHYLRKRVARKSRRVYDISPWGIRIDGRRIFPKRTKKRKWNRQSSWKRHGETGGKKRADWFFAVGQLIWREKEREREREKESTVAGWSIVRRARPLDDSQLEKYSNSITIFFVRSHTESRKNFKPLSPTTRNTFVERDRWAWVARGWRHHGGGTWN